MTWTIWLAKGLELVWAKRRRALQLTSCGTPKAMRMEHEGSSPDGREAACRILVDEAINETRLSEGLSAEGVKERVAIELSRIEARAGRGMTRGTHLLATIGATAPFVG